MSHTESERRVERAVARIGSSGKEKDEAFRVLFENGQQVLNAYLRGKASAYDAEEIIQNIFLRILKNWERLNFESVSAWYKYVHEAAKHSFYDLDRKGKEIEYVESSDNRTDPYYWITDMFAGESVNRIADRVWLGSEPPDASKRYLAAQLHFIDGVKLVTVAKRVNYDQGKTEQTKNEEVLSWISETWVIRKLAFQQLNISNEHLTALILGLDPTSKIDFGRIGVLAKSSPPDSIAFGNWKWREVDFILLRYLAGIPFYSALDKTVNPTTKEAGLSIHDRSSKHFPFVDKMTELWNSLEDVPQRNEALTKNPLWKRLTFQYVVAHQLPQNDILDRISPPASVVGCPIKTVAVWIASRLEEDVRKYKQSEKFVAYE